MTTGGYRVELETLRRARRGLCELADEVRDSIDEPLAPSAGGNAGFASVQAARTVVHWAIARGWAAGGELV